MLKDNRVAIKRTWSTVYQDGEIEIGRYLRMYEEFDRNGNNILQIRFDNDGDTLEEITFVRNDIGQVLREYQDCLDTCLVWYWESSYSQGHRDNVTAFSRDGSVVASTKYIYDEQGLLSKYYSSRREESQAIMTYDDRSTGDPIRSYHTSYDTVYDTTIVEYSGNTTRYSSLSGSQPSVYTDKYDADGFLLEQVSYYDSEHVVSKETFEYDTNGNRILEFITKGTLIHPYVKECYVYDGGNLMVRMEYYHTNLDLPQVISEFEYEHFDK